MSGFPRWNSVARRIWRWFALTQDQLAISDFIRAEIIRVLCGKFARDAEELESQLDELLIQALWVEVAGEVRGACRDPNDDAILETALKAQADYLVAGDKDLLSLGKLGKTKIISPAAYLEFQ